MTVMPSLHNPKQNHVRAALPGEDYARLLPDLELIPMPLGWMERRRFTAEFKREAVRLAGQEGCPVRTWRRNWG